MNSNNLVYIPVEELYPHPDNPRKELGDLTELAESIKSKGIMQNLTVVPRLEGGYTVIIGHRRSAAAKAAGLGSVPCVVVEMSEREQVATMLLENMQRVDLTVYEQAQGFQMMIDLGESVDSISEKTGFSKSTVKRRLKMAELDAETLRQISTQRQLSIGDFDKIAQIEDIGKRNELLRDIGTNNFEHSYTRALKQQKIARAIPFVKQAIKAFKGKKIERHETYGVKYTKILEVKLEEFKEGDTLKVPQEHQDKKLFYYLNESWGELNVYIRTPRATPVKRSKEELEREKRIEEAHATLNALTAEAYELRLNFVKGMSVNKSNENAVRDGAILALLSEQSWYNSHINKHEIYKKDVGVEGIENVYDTNVIFEKALTAYRSSPKRNMPLIIYISFGDTKAEGFHTTYAKEHPKYRKNTKLFYLYEWLLSCGYVMSDDEIMLRDGTHPVFEK